MGSSLDSGCNINFRFQLFRLSLRTSKRISLSTKSMFKLCALEGLLGTLLRTSMCSRDIKAIYGQILPSRDISLVDWRLGDFFWNPEAMGGQCLSARPCAPET